MQFNLPKSRQVIWTKHVLDKMRQYQLSGQRLLRLIRRPERRQSGVAPNTIAVMQTVGSAKRPTEIWLMYQLVDSLRSSADRQNDRRSEDGKKIKIITAWRYPGISPRGEALPIPSEIIKELNI